VERIRTKANMEPFQDSSLLHSGTPAFTESHRHMGRTRKASRGADGKR
jgi:hypothetical protein